MEKATSVDKLFPKVVGVECAQGESLLKIEFMKGGGTRLSSLLDVCLAMDLLVSWS